jgi:flagellar motor switch protein FliG
MDEFLDSPILKVGGMSWIAKLNNQEMAAVAAKLSAEDLPVFFACLSPVRVKNIIEQVNDNEAKAKFFLGLAQIATVTQEKVEPFFERLRTLEPKTDRAGGKNSSQLVNAEKYLKQAVDSMEAIDQEKVFSYLDQSSPVSQALRRQFLPFEAIRKVPVAIMRELFGERANDQIAQILFASPPDLRDLVLSSLPDIKQQTVKDKLKQLDGDSVYKKRHEQKSYQAQKAITSYIAQLLQEGIITLDDADGSRPLSEVNSAA